MSTQTQPAAPPPSTAGPEAGVHPDHDRGLEFDVRTLLARRSALGLLSGAGLLALVGDEAPVDRAEPIGRVRRRLTAGALHREGGAVVLVFLPTAKARKTVSL